MAARREASGRGGAPAGKGAGLLTSGPGSCFASPVRSKEGPRRGGKKAAGSNWGTPGIDAQRWGSCLESVARSPAGKAARSDAR